MRNGLTVGASAAAILLMMTGCMTDTAGQDPSGSSPSADVASPDSTAGSDDVVALTTPYPITVLEKDSRGDGPQLCVGGVAESFPPQCSGVDLLDWSWDDEAGAFQERAGVRWGEFMVTGDFSPADHTMRVTDVQTDGPEPSPRPPRCTDDCEQPTDELLAIASEITGEYDGVHSSAVDGTGTVEVGVSYDDGSLQRALDEKYGAGLIRVESTLVPVEE